MGVPDYWSTPRLGQSLLCKFSVEERLGSRFNLSEPRRPSRPALCICSLPPVGQRPCTAPAGRRKSPAGCTTLVIFWGRDPALSGLETWSLPLASPNGATACSQRLQSGRLDVADWCIVLFQFQCRDVYSNSLLAEPENSRNSAHSTGGTQLHKPNSRLPRWRSSKRASDQQWGTDSQTCQPSSSTARSERTQERKALGWFVRAPPAACIYLVGQCTLNSVVLPRAWPNQSRFRTLC